MTCFVDDNCFFYNKFHCFEAGAAGGIIAETDADQCIAVLFDQRLRPSLPRL